MKPEECGFNNKNIHPNDIIVIEEYRQFLEDIQEAKYRIECAELTIKILKEEYNQIILNFDNRCKNGPTYKEIAEFKKALEIK